MDGGGHRHRQQQEQESACCRRQPHGEVGVGGEADQLDGERGRRAGAEHDGDIDHREREGQDGAERQAQEREELRQHQLGPGLGRAVAEAARHPELAGGVDLAHRGQDREQEEGGLPYREAQREGDTPGVVQGQQVGWALPAGEPGRGQPCQPARGGGEEGEADGACQMRHGQEHRQQQRQRAAERGVVGGGGDGGGGREGQGGGDEAAAEGDGQRMAETGHCQEPAPGLETGLVGADRRQPAEGRQGGAEEAGRDRPQEDQDGERRGKAEQEALSGRSAPPRPSPSAPSSSGAARGAVA